MIDSETIKGMRERATAWASDRGGNLVTRELAIGEDHMALDVLELLDEVERLRRERDNARANARILAHSYTHDSRPPQHVVDESLAYPARPEAK